MINSVGGVSGFFSGVGGLIVSPTRYLAVTYDTDSVFVTAAIPGDANLDGTVNIGDFAILASQFNTTGPWTEGNFNGDAIINIGDFALLATNFNQSLPAPLPRAAVPEPSGLFFAAGILLALRARWTSHEVCPMKGAACTSGANARRLKSTIRQSRAGGLG